MGRKIDSHQNSHVGSPARGYLDADGQELIPATGLHKPRWERSGRSGDRRRQRRRARRRERLGGATAAAALSSVAEGVGVQDDAGHQHEAPAPVAKEQELLPGVKLLPGQSYDDLLDEGAELADGRS